ncbi:leukocyte surface antigen CD47-like [Coturnix japonica]|uniref:leukocyte surface antigen CD47-like n=1 Tax=Coturnix japonica TaxID=93934 RepID=UPI000777EABA|nr:leukocyte surface antigen CD47-like [Coturnix japonica]
MCAAAPFQPGFFPVAAAALEVGWQRAVLPSWRSAMWLLTTGAVLAVLGKGSTELRFDATKFVEKYACNDVVILPCIVTNLRESNVSKMHVRWMVEDRVVFAFHGPNQSYYRDPSLPSAVFAAEADLAKGDASLQLKSSEAKDANYTCEVTELNREGETKVELRTRTGELPVIFIFIFFMTCWE